jgi:hypothetical protein
MVPLSALAQVENSESSMSGRGDESCQGAAHLMTGLGVDPTTTFAGQPPLTTICRASLVLGVAGNVPGSGMSEQSRL